MGPQSLLLVLPKAQALREGLGNTALHPAPGELEREVDGIHDIQRDLGPYPKGRVVRGSEPLPLCAV